MRNFSCRARTAADAVVIDVIGGVDLATTDLLMKTAAEHLSSGIPLVVDCSRITFLNSVGLKGLLEIRRQAVNTGSDLVLAAPSHCVSRVLELSGTQHVFQLHAGARAVVPARGVPVGRAAKRELPDPTCDKRIQVNVPRVASYRHDAE